MAVIALLEGAGVAAGLLLIISGLIPRAGWHRRSPRLAMGLSHRRLTRLAAASATAAAIGIATRWPVGAVLAGVAAWTLPAMLGRDRYLETVTARTEAVASWAEMLRDNLGAAAGLEQAIVAAATLPPVAIADEIAGLASEIRSGARLTQALARFADQLADPTADLVVRALQQAARRQASNLADLLTELAALARARVSARLRVAAGRARVRTSARMVIATTITMALALALLNRRYLAAYNSPAGQLAMLVAGALFAVGFLGLARLSRFGDTPVPADDPGGSP